MKIKQLQKTITLSAMLLAALAPAAVRGSFTIGNLAVEQLNTNGNSTTFKIVELNPYVTNAAPVNTIAIPFTGASALRQSSSASDGRLALTLDRTLLAFTGAADATGTSDETTILLRGVGTLDANGKYTLQTSYTGKSGNQARSATSLDDLTWYMGDKGGIFTNGQGTAANTANVRPLKSFGGQIYALSANSPANVVSVVSAGGKTITGLPGLAVDVNALDFYMIASGFSGITNDIIYVNDGTNITKYSLSGGSWAANGSANIGVAADGLCAMGTGTGANLYVTTGPGGSVIEISDTAGYNAAPSITTNNNVTIYAGAPYLKGIEFAPEPNLAIETLATSATSSTFSIVELNPNLTNATPVNTIPIPSTGGSALRQSSAGSTGRLALSQDRTLLAFTGAQDGTGVADETSVNLRGVGTIDSGANYVLQATYTGVGGSTANQTRVATSLNNLTWYIGDKGGIYTNNTVTPVNPTNMRGLRSYNGVVYVCAATSKTSATVSVINTLSLDGTTLTPLPGLETATDANALDFYMIQSGLNGTNYDIAYVNDGATVTKYCLFGGSWSLAGTATLGVTADGICAVNIGGGALLYVTTGSTAGASVIQITDTTGINQAPVINTANNVILFTGGVYAKGIDFAPVASATAQTALAPPTLLPATGATVDAPFTITFVETPAWRAAITNILVNSLTLSPAAYVVSAGQIVFTPSASTVLQTSGIKNIAIGATGYSIDLLAQNLGSGAATHLSVTAQPTGPTGDGGTLVAQPSVAMQDQYGNAAVTVTASVTASVASGAWSFGPASGTNVAVVNGVGAFTNLSALSAAAVNGAAIHFTVSGSGLSGLPTTTTNATAFNIPAPSTAFSAGNIAVFQEDVAANNSTFSILELSPSVLNQSAPVNTFAISATGTNAMRESSAATTGRLAVTDDGTLLSFAAFEDSSALTGDETTVTNRGVGTLNPSGNYVLQTSYSGVSGGQARSATSVDDINWFIGDKGGVYMNNETALNPFIGGTGSNVRSLKSFAGNVYALQQFSSSLNRSVLQVVLGDGVLWPLTGFPEDANVSDFYIVRSGQNGNLYDTMYYLDGTNSTSGSIFKFCISSNPGDVDAEGFPIWLPFGQVNTTNGGDGLYAVTNLTGGVDLYYTTGSEGQAGNSLVKVTDSGVYGQNISLSAPQTLYTATSLATLKGVAPTPTLPFSTVTVPPISITPGTLHFAVAVSGPGSSTVQFSFTNAPGVGSLFNILATTNLALPRSQWQNLGTPSESPAGQYLFTDLSATNQYRFYTIQAMR
jgi:hypothetical protein